MGQKVNPHGLRVGVIKDWDSRWFANKKDFGATLVEDYNLRKTLKAQLYNFGISKIENSLFACFVHFDNPFEQYRLNIRALFSTSTHVLAPFRLTYRFFFLR